MSVAPAVVSALSSVAGGRVFPLTAPLSTALPYCVYSVIGEEELLTMQQNASPRMHHTRLQVDIFSRTYAECQTVAGQIRDAMVAASGFKALPSTRFDLYEDEVKLFRVLSEFSVWHTV